jgi:hypothetical protein
VVQAERTLRRSDPYTCSQVIFERRRDLGQKGKSWWGTVTGFQPPGSIDFHHTITVRQLRAMVDVHIHYSFEPAEVMNGEPI